MLKLSQSQMQKHHERKRTVRKVGFYGCQRGLVRVAVKKLPPSGEYPRKVRIKCPGCGHEHDIAPAWRPYSERLDAGKKVLWIG